MPPAAGKKKSVLWRPFEPITKGIYKRVKGSGRVPHEKKSKSTSFIWLFRHHNNNIYPFWKEDDDEDQGFVGDERAWGRRSLAPNRPGSSSFGLSREHARKREREREREKERVVSN